MLTLLDTGTAQCLTNIFHHIVPLLSLGGHLHGQSRQIQVEGKHKPVARRGPVLIQMNRAIATHVAKYEVEN